MHGSACSRSHSALFEYDLLTKEVKVSISRLCSLCILAYEYFWSKLRDYNGSSQQKYIAFYRKLKPRDNNKCI